MLPLSSNLTAHRTFLQKNQTIIKLIAHQNIYDYNKATTTKKLKTSVYSISPFAFAETEVITVNAWTFDTYLAGISDLLFIHFLPSPKRITVGFSNISRFSKSEIYRNPEYRLLAGSLAF